MMMRRAKLKRDDCCMPNMSKLQIAIVPIKDHINGLFAISECGQWSCSFSFEKLEFILTSADTHSIEEILKNVISTGAFLNSG